MEPNEREVISTDHIIFYTRTSVNGAFERANAVDELSLVVPSVITDFRLVTAENENGILILSYKK